MTVVAAFLVPGLPHPIVRPGVVAWDRIAAAGQKAGRALAAAKPDTIVIYSTQWVAVLDQLWQTRPRMAGTHVDENWYDWGHIDFDIRADTELAYGCIANSGRAGLKSRAVNYDEFPTDTGTLVADRMLNSERVHPLVVTSNNIYHDFPTTEKLGAMVAATAREQGKRIAVVGVGGLSARMFRMPIEPREDRFADAGDDRINRRVLDRMERGDADGLRRECAAVAGEAPVDFGLKHVAFLLGALGGRFTGARVHGYGPIYGTGAAVVEWRQ